jgi:hypothetical protein
MNRKPITILAVAAFALAGCKTPTHVDKGPIKAATFNFFHPGPLPDAAFTENRQQIHALIQQAISNHLGTRGLNRVAQGGDVTVAYLIVVGNNGTTSAINDYFGYSDDATALQDKAHAAYTEGNQRDYFEAGTLLIDIQDSHTKKLLWRNYVTRPLLRNAPLDVRQSRIQEAVDTALNGLHVER